MPAVVRDDLVFVHIPKCGGTSISEWFSDGKKYVGHPKLETLGTRPFSFTVVRNPWDRVVSAYHYLFKKEKDTNFQSYIDKGMPTFEEFVRDMKGVRVPELWFDGETNQCEWFRSGVDVILRYETLETDFKVIQDMLQKWDTLPHCNKSEHIHYREYYTCETRDIVAKTFSEDINMFKYTF